MSTSLIAMGVAIFLVINLVIGLAALSLLFGTFETLFGKPKLTILRSTKSGNYFAFGFKWNSAKEPASIETVRLRLFNPFGSPTQVEVSKNFEPKSSSFANEVDLGPGFIDLLGAKNFDLAVIEVQIYSQKDGINFTFEMKGPKFKKLISEANMTVEQFVAANKLDAPKTSKPPIDIPIRSFIADTVPGRGPALKMATNPAFAGDFSAAPTTTGGAGGANAAAAVPNFKVAKVWIEPGCIVCNACEDIYKEVFEVLADTCIIRPNAPLDDGLRMQEAAEACPVEVIKFTIAS
ncbi:MAG TPA: ferredoxin [Bacteriovoracaceae bacterium]|nr:ferredoxin [Bacteriovoracaceae bacterium]